MVPAYCRKIVGATLVRIEILRSEFFHVIKMNPEENKSKGTFESTSAMVTIYNLAILGFASFTRMI